MTYERSGLGDRYVANKLVEELARDGKGPEELLKHKRGKVLLAVYKWEAVEKIIWPGEGDVVPTPIEKSVKPKPRRVSFTEMSPDVPRIPSQSKRKESGKGSIVVFAPPKEQYPDGNDMGKLLVGNGPKIYSLLTFIEPEVWGTKPMSQFARDFPSGHKRTAIHVLAKELTLLRFRPDTVTENDAQERFNTRKAEILGKIDKEKGLMETKVKYLMAANKLIDVVATEVSRFNGEDSSSAQV